MFAGIDIAKERLDVYLRPTGEAFSVPTPRRVLAALLERLTASAPTLIALEATGGYAVTVAAALASARVPVPSSILARCAISLGGPGSSPRPSPWTLWSLSVVARGRHR